MKPVCFVIHVKLTLLLLTRQQKLDDLHQRAKKECIILLCCDSCFFCSTLMSSKQPNLTLQYVPQLSNLGQGGECNLGCPGSPPGPAPSCPAFPSAADTPRHDPIGSPL